MKFAPILGTVSAMTIAFQATAGVTEIFVDQDYMSSGFFQSDFLRGEEANSGRAVNRTTSPTIFGVTGETSYFDFDFDPSAFSGPILQATFSVETAVNGFFPDPDPSNPSEISLHRLTSDPLAAIDQSLASGPGSWLEFRDSQITTSSIESTTTVDGLGVFSWDVTSLVNEWIQNGDSNFAYTFGMSALLDPEGGAAVGFVNSSFSGLGGDEFIARISITAVPGPGGLVLLSISGLAARGRRRRSS